MSALHLQIDLVDRDEAFEFPRQLAGFENDVSHCLEFFYVVMPALSRALERQASLTAPNLFDFHQKTN
jgi:hypothetical protein